MSEAPTVFVADPALRLEAPQARRRPRARLAAATFAALALEAGVFALVWFERNVTPPPPPEAIPVEIVQEPPPPPPPPPQPEIKNQDYEKPATDAPREGKSDHDDENVAEKETPAAAPPPPPVATPSPEATKPAAETPAPELPKTAEAEAPPPQKVEPPAPAEKPKPTVADILSHALSIPDVELGGEAIQSPVTGGNAKSNYMSILYGLIVPRLHVPAIAHAYGRRLQGAVGFTVDGRGRLMQRVVVEGSGSSELDEAAMEAVAAASKSFPAPPKGAPIGMKFTYSVD